VVDLFHPGGEQAVQFRQGVHPGADTVCGGGDLDQELVPDGAEVSFYLGAALLQ
jgi:hypothetical protein